MRAISRSLAIVAIGLSVWRSSAAPAAATRTAMVTVRAEVGACTSLHASVSMLRFEVSLAGTESAPPVTVEFRAAARTKDRADVLLTVEPAGVLEGPSGAADAEMAVVFTGEGDGTESGVLNAAGPQVAARWTGGGVRQGRLTFTFSGPIAPGTYLLPVRFVLSTP